MKNFANWEDFEEWFDDNFLDILDRADNYADGMIYVEDDSYDGVGGTFDLYYAPDSEGEVEDEMDPNEYPYHCSYKAGYVFGKLQDAAAKNKLDPKDEVAMALATLARKCKHVNESKNISRASKTTKKVKDIYESLSKENKIKAVKYMKSLKESAQSEDPLKGRKRNFLFKLWDERYPEWINSIDLATKQGHDEFAEWLGDDWFNIQEDVEIIQGAEMNEKKFRRILYNAKYWPTLLAAAKKCDYREDALNAMAQAIVDNHMC